MEIVNQMSKAQQELVNRITDACRDSFNRAIKPRNVTDPLEFTGKFVHLFCNCINSTIDRTIYEEFIKYLASDLQFLKVD